MYIEDISTSKRSEMIDITMCLKKIVQSSSVKKGVIRVFVPHTTAGVTINENSDPDVISDMLRGLEKFVPYENNYKHLEGNSAAHIKASIIGSSISVFVEDGELKLGRWQGVYFCEFDGPRKRRVFIDLL